MRPLVEAGYVYIAQPPLYSTEVGKSKIYLKDDASLDAYLRPFGAAHGFEEVIAVTLESDADHVLTGRLARPNVRGPEKARRLDEWLRGETPAYLWAYGNSSGDRELLAMADQPVWIGRRRRSLDARGRRTARVARTT